MPCWPACGSVRAALGAQPRAVRVVPESLGSPVKVPSWLGRQPRNVPVTWIRAPPRHPLGTRGPCCCGMALDVEQGPEQQKGRGVTHIHNFQESTLGVQSGPVTTKSRRSPFYRPSSLAGGRLACVPPPPRPKMPLRYPAPLARGPLQKGPGGKMVQEISQNRLETSVLTSLMIPDDFGKRRF